MSSITKTVETTTVEVKVAQSEIKVTGKIVAAIREFEDAKTAIKALKDRQTLAEATIRAALGDALKGTYKGLTVVEVKSSTNTSVDMKALREIFPEAAEATIKSKPYTFLKGSV